MENEKNNLRQIKKDEEEVNRQIEQGVEDVDIRKYHDREGLSVASLDLGLWYVEKKQSIIEAVYFFFFLLGILCWAYFFYEYGSYVVSGIKTEKILAREVLASNLPEYAYYDNSKPVNLEIHPTFTISNNANKRDIIGQIKNPNIEHWARFDYHFLNNSEKLVEKKGFILPGETKQILELGRDIPESIGGLSMVLENIEWGRVNPHHFGKWDVFEKEHLNIVFSNIVFSPSENSTLSEKLPLSTLSFVTENKTTFNYWNVPLVISFYNYSDLESITTYEVNDFKSAETRAVNLTLPGNLRRITEVKIKPALDITRFDIYKEFKAPLGTFR